MKRSATLPICLVAVALGFAASVSARAEFGAKDAQILGRTLGYTGDGVSGSAMVGIVFVPANPASKHEAELVSAIIGDGLATGRVHLRARLIPVDQLAGATGVNALYLTAGLAGSADVIFASAEHLKVPTIAANLDCVGSGRCVVGYISEPTVQILLNQAAAERIGVHFLQAFRMLVREQ